MAGVHRDALLEAFVSSSSLPAELPSEGRPRSFAAFRSDVCDAILRLNELERKKNLLRTDDDLSSEKREELKADIESFERSKKIVSDGLREALRRAKRARNERSRRKRRRAEKKTRAVNELERRKIELPSSSKAKERERERSAALAENARERADAERCLRTLESLSELRSSREKLALGRGEKICLESSISFSRSIAKLKLLWQEAISRYKAEEVRLRQASRDTSEPSEKSEKIDMKSQICEILFGSLEPRKNFGGNINNFLFARARWDQYVTEVEGSSQIPIGWVVPDPPSGEKWKPYAPSI